MKGTGVDPFSLPIEVGFQWWENDERWELVAISGDGKGTAILRGTFGRAVNPTATPRYRSVSLHRLAVLAAAGYRGRLGPRRRER